jgi:curved DNA-binding protein CbpA
MRTHYDNLHVSEKASPEVIKGAYKALTQKWHPDKNPDQREKAERYFKIITRSFEVLSDPKARAEYDAWLEVQRTEQGPDDLRAHHERQQQKSEARKTEKQAADQARMAEAWEDGKRAGTAGEPANSCVYGGDFASAWMNGYEQGIAASSAHPWRRFLARLIDLPLVILTTIVVLYICASGVELLIARDIRDQLYSSPALFLLAAAATLIAYETIFIEQLSATPGKWVLGISVTFPEQRGALRRTIYANAVGQGLHIPLLSFAANIASFIYLTKTKSTYWDNKAGSLVHCKPMTFIRALCTTLALVIASALYIAITDALRNRFH